MTWACSRTGIEVTVHAQVDDPDIATSIGLGLRRNPKRAQLLVSAVLGKHVPVRASVCLKAGALLGSVIDAPGPYDVIGFAETATGLGHQVAHGLGDAFYIHTTRRPGEHPQLSFLEEHSHAMDQALTPPPGAFNAAHTAVLVDDEISTGRTALNAIAALDTGHTTWVLASLLDTRSPEDRAWCAARAAELGVTLIDACLLTGSVTLQDDSAFRAQELVATVEPPVVTAPEPFETRHFRLGTAGLKTTARRGFDARDDAALRLLAKRAAAALQEAGALGDDGDVTVVGDEELMYFPQLLALELGDRPTCTTTRSPALAIDADGYPLRSAVAFDSISEPGRLAFSYNTKGTRVLLVTEDPVDDRGVLAALRPVAVLTLDPTLPLATPPTTLLAFEEKPLHSGLQLKQEQGGGVG